MTARSYEDLEPLYGRPCIAEDIASLFNYLTGFGRPSRFQKILVAPFGLRTRLIERIRAAGQAAAEGKHARVRLKLNAITDEAMIEELYTASQHGATIEIVARSICMLKPGVPGMSENITRPFDRRPLPGAQPPLRIRDRRRRGRSSSAAPT